MQYINLRNLQKWLILMEINHLHSDKRYPCLPIDIQLWLVQQTDLSHLS